MPSSSSAQLRFSIPWRPAECRWTRSPTFMPNIKVATKAEPQRRIRPQSFWPMQPRRTSQVPALRTSSGTTHNTIHPRARPRTYTPTPPGLRIGGFKTLRGRRSGRSGSDNGPAAFEAGDREVVGGRPPLRHRDPVAASRLIHEQGVGQSHECSEWHGPYRGL